jgi:hypothetical protein
MLAGLKGKVTSDNFAIMSEDEYLAKYKVATDALDGFKELCILCDNSHFSNDTSRVETIVNAFR